MESPGSPLSEYSSEDFPEDVKREGRSLSVDTTTYPHDTHGGDTIHLRPTKRQRTGPGPSTWDASSRRTPQPGHHELPSTAGADDDYVSEDTEGSVPASPMHPGLGSGGTAAQDEESLGAEQVTVCKWDGCTAGDLGNMDKLVEHLHEEHIGSRQKKYACEWGDCGRKGISHASGYALRAHMRSHTREKPFYCSLPECDRAFTRSDALAKHMRTVHETEALRPSDPVPKSHSSNPTNRLQRVKLVIGKSTAAAANTNGTDASSRPASPSHPHPPQPSTTTTPAAAADTDYGHNNVVYIRNAAHTTDPSQPPWLPQFPLDVSFTPSDLQRGPAELFRLLRRQLHWAAEEGTLLRREMEGLERARREAWAAKELVLENVMEAEWAFVEGCGLRRPDGVGSDGGLVGRLGEAERVEVRRGMEEDVGVARGLEMRGSGRVPWRRRGKGDELGSGDGGVSVEGRGRRGKMVVDGGEVGEQGQAAAAATEA